MKGTQKAGVDPGFTAGSPGNLKHFGLGFMVWSNQNLRVAYVLVGTKYPSQKVRALDTSLH